MHKVYIISFVMEANMILMTVAMITAIGSDRVRVILVIGNSF